ncbi:cytochrome ubiquinol oxidase subunit I, partial [Streptomyces cadmiisoli]|uniref:cytochrome ubiquinol oxidase subunit I n=1 Tax=Streptomyces cadmiisoli TaxID=2184053 RepID=UPI003657F4B4
MHTTLHLLAEAPPQMLPARSLMAFTLASHIILVPMGVALPLITLIMHGYGLRRGDATALLLARRWSAVMAVQFAIGVVTGTVLSFEFGLLWPGLMGRWGDVFGIGFGVEAWAFFLEAVLIAIYLYGWRRLPARTHFLLGLPLPVTALLGAFGILAANSWMQHPVGYRINEERGRAELTDFWLVLTQNTALTQFFHTITAAFLVGGAFMAGISAFHLARKKHIPVMRSSLRLGLIVLIIAGTGTAISGDLLGKVMFKQQPMKMAAAEALWDGEAPAPFSVFAYGDVEKGHNKVAIEIPGLLSFLANDDFTSFVPGINDVNKAEQEKFGPGDYRPNIPVAYWGFRWMIGFGMASLGVGVLGLWLTRKKFMLPAGLRTGE